MPNRLRLKLPRAEAPMTYALSPGISYGPLLFQVTSKLTGWQVDIEPEEVTIVGFDQQVAQAVQAIAAIPGITTEQADVLVHHGFTSLSDLLQADQSDLAGIPQIAEQAAALYEAARAEAARRQIKVGEAQTPVA